MALDDIAGLLDEIRRLPEDRARRARERVARAIERPAPEARARLGLLALDLAEPEVVVVPETPTAAGGQPTAPTAAPVAAAVAAAGA